MVDASREKTSSSHASTTGTESRAPRFATFLLGLSIFSTGASGLVNEYILATVSTYVLGNSIEQFSLVIAAMLLMMGLAGWLQKQLSNKHMLEKFLGIEIILAILGGFAPIAMYAGFGLAPDHFVFIQYFFVMSIGFLIGFEIPLVLRINERYSDTLKTNLASILSMDYVGAFLGAIVWVFILLKLFPLTEISFLVAGFNFIVASATFIYFMKHKLVSLKRISLIAIVITLGILIMGFSSNRSWNAVLEQKFFDNPIVYRETTKYQHLVLTHDPITNDYRLYLNGNTQFSSLDEMIYHEHLVHPAMKLVPAHKRVLILGGGDGLALREVLKYDHVESITLVDLDPAMTQIASSNPVLQTLNNNAFSDARVHTEIPDALSTESVRGVYLQSNQVDPKGEYIAEHVASVDVYNLDADRFIGAIDNQYDVIIIDFPDPNSVELAKLYSKEFYLKLKHRVSPDGLIAIQSTSPYHAKEAFLTIRRTIEAAGLTTLPYHDNVPSFGDWGWLLAWNSNESAEFRAEQIRQIASYDVETRYLTPEVSTAALVFGKGALTPKTENIGKINTLMFPVLFTLYREHSWIID